MDTWCIMKFLLIWRIRRKQPSLAHLEFLPIGECPLDYNKDIYYSSFKKLQYFFSDFLFHHQVESFVWLCYWFEVLFKVYVVEADGLDYSFEVGDLPS